MPLPIFNHSTHRVSAPLPDVRPNAPAGTPAAARFSAPLATPPMTAAQSEARASLRSEVSGRASMMSTGTVAKEASWADRMIDEGVGALGIDDAAPRAQSDRDPKTARRVAANRAQIDLGDAVGNAKRARQAGVEGTKANFWKRVGRAAFVAAIVGLLTATAVATGGALAIAAAATMGVMLVKASLDTLHAHRMVQNARAEAQGLRKPYDLPMGDDAVANYVHKLLPDSLSSEKKTQWAKGLSFGLSAAISATVGIASGGAALLPSAMACLSAGLATGVYAYTQLKGPLSEPGLHEADGVALQQYLELGARVADMREEALGLDMSPAGIDRINALGAALLADVDAMAQRVEATTVLYAPQGTAEQLGRDLVPDLIQQGLARGAKLPGMGAVGNALKAGLVLRDVAVIAFEKNEREQLLAAAGRAADRVGASVDEARARLGGGYA